VAKLVFQSGPYAGKSITLPAGKTLTMGRNRDLELPLPDLKLSRRHCQILFAGEQCILKDLGSTNGTFLNGERLSGEVELNDFDRIVLGDTEIEFHSAEKVPLPHQFDTEAADPFGVHANIPDRKSAPAIAAVEELDEIEIPSAAPVPQAPQDPFEAALKEMLQALPPEPPPLNFSDEAAARKPKLMFCESCEGSIPMLDWDLGLAREIENKIFCKDCLAKGVVIAPQKNEPAQVKSAGAEKSLSAIMAGLDQEAEVVDTTLKRGNVEIAENDAARRASELEKAKQLAIRRVEPPKPSPQKVSSSVRLKDELGDEFEEIG
jgi:pSer/pThr/pTyr-binding forkhead associated (FHA) protein